MAGMLATPSAQYIPATQPRDFGAQLEASFKLALASWKPLFWLCFWLNGLAQLPLLGWWWRTREVFAVKDLRALLNLDVQALAFNASDGALALVAMAVSLWFSIAATYRMACIARGDDPGFSASLATAARKFPGSLVLMVIYFALLAVCLLPVAAAWWLVPGGDFMDALMPRLVAMLLALLVVSVPLGWVSVAAMFAAPAFWLDGDGVIAAQWRSFQLVRGNFLCSASVVTATMLAWLGFISLAGTIPLTLTASITMAADGWLGLLRPGWLVWGQLLSTPLLALFTPLCFAGWLVCYEDLRLRQG